MNFQIHFKFDGINNLKFSFKDNFSNLRFLSHFTHVETIA